MNEDGYWPQIVIANLKSLVDNTVIASMRNYIGYTVHSISSVHLDLLI